MPELIDRAKLLEYLAAIKPDEYVSAYGEAAVDVINHVETYVNEMPTIEAEPVRHGRWIQRRNIEYYCTNCGREERFIFQKYFCPRCGARMDATDTNVGGKGGADNGNG